MYIFGEKLMKLEGYIRKYSLNAKENTKGERHKT
jgi:hypothetical protein